MWLVGKINKLIGAHPVKQLGLDPFQGKSLGGSFFIQREGNLIQWFDIIDPPCLAAVILQIPQEERGFLTLTNWIHLNRAAGIISLWPELSVHLWLGPTAALSPARACVMGHCLTMLRALQCSHGLLHLTRSSLPSTLSPVVSLSSPG